jgi:hypothetical protein
MSGKDCSYNRTHLFSYMMSAPSSATNESSAPVVRVNVEPEYAFPITTTLKLERKRVLCSRVAYPCKALSYRRAKECSESSLPAVGGDIVIQFISRENKSKGKLVLQYSGTWTTWWEWLMCR